MDVRISQSGPKILQQEPNLVPTYRTTEILSNYIFEIYLICRDYSLTRSLTLGESSVYKRIFEVLMSGVYDDVDKGEDKAHQYRSAGFLGSGANLFAERKQKLLSLIDKMLVEGMICDKAHERLKKLFESLSFPIAEGKEGVDVEAMTVANEQ
jgi:hypothetical protein